MNRGIYPPLAGAITLERRLDVLTHNIGNVHTTGFKKDKPVFETILARVAGPPVAGIDLFPQIATVRPDLMQGTFRHTGRSLDLALNGEGFFVVSKPEGLRHFRGGSLQRNGNGELVTHTGDHLMGKKGPIKLSPGEIVVDENGQIRVNNVVVDQLRIERVPEGMVPVKAGDLYWMVPDKVESATGTRVLQGKLEKSNVEASIDLIEMIKVTRGYEQMQRAIRTMDELTGQIIQAGRVQA